MHTLCLLFIDFCVVRKLVRGSGGTCAWFMRDLCKVSCLVRGWYVICAWSVWHLCVVVHGVCIICAWYESLCVVCAWFVRTLCMVYAWFMHGPRICAWICVWFVCDFSPFVRAGNGFVCVLFTFSIFLHGFLHFYTQTLTRLTSLRRCRGIEHCA